MLTLQDLIEDDNLPLRTLLGAFVQALALLALVPFSRNDRDMPVG